MAAEQARLTAELDTARCAREAAEGVPAAKRGKGLAAEIALARNDSPHRGGRHIGFARALVHEMPHTLDALEAGALSEWRATLIVRESACLSIEDRGILDARMCADQSALEGKGDKRIEAQAKSIAYELDPQAVVDRAVRAESERTVTSRPAPNNMAYVTALLPMKQGVAVYAALRRAADTTVDGRGRGQVMADTLVERVTGRPAEVPVPVEVNLVMSDQTLLGGEMSPALVDGYGPIPADVARELVGAAVTDNRSAATLRRLYRHPTSGALVAMESRSRRFPKGLARFIGLRDQRCRTPYLRRADSPSRPRGSAKPRWPNERGQWTRHVRTVQLRQGITGLDGVDCAKKMASTQQNSSPPPARHIDRRHLHYQDHRSSRSAKSRSGSVLHSPIYTSRRW